MRYSCFLALMLAPLVWPQSEDFETRIRPILATRCYGCHSAAKRTSGLAVDSKSGLESGGSRGTAIRPGDPAASLLLKAISYADPALKMPPDGKLPDSVIADFRAWIARGAEDPRTTLAPTAPVASMDWERARKHWAFQPIGAPAKAQSIDALLTARIQHANLPFAPPADRPTLLRRITFDLTGLPPSPAELQQFLHDQSPGAYQKVVDRLLASPRYGERWARHWLDLVRFAETNGHEFDFYKDEAWRYRDYVIRAFNQDLPYNTFVHEHVLGDAISPQRLSPDGQHQDSTIASGFFGLGEERNGATDLEEVRGEMRDSKIDVFGKTFLGLTIACARCHDHKFDPIPTTDYYALGGVFDSTRTTLASISSPQVRATIEAALAQSERPPPPAFPSPELRPNDQLFDLRQFYRSGAAFPEGPSIDSSRSLTNQLTGIMVSRSFVPTRKFIHIRLAGTLYKPVREEPSQLAVTIFAPGRYPKGVAGSGDRKFRWRTITLQEEIKQVCHLEIADRRTDGHIAVTAIVFSDSKEPPPDPPEALASLPTEFNTPIPAETFGRITYEDVAHNLRVHERGSHFNLGAEVPRGFLQVLDSSAPSSFSNGSGRASLALALTGPSAPLLARVMVNRIWQHHFGEGLVRTVDNFGKSGERPSHPELLDFLAHQFVANRWSVKVLHRLILLTQAYQRDSAAPHPNDPQNRLLSHMSVRRLDAESVRDAILSVSGSLDPATGGPSIPVHVSEYQVGRGKPPSGALDGKGRRSIYLEVRRNFLTPVLLAFDYPLPSSTIGRRLVSTVPAQALTLMNNEFVISQSAQWAARIAAAYPDPRRRLDAMFFEIFARPPLPSERDRIATFLSANSWQDLAHVLFNAKEFLFLR
ncbi:MAG: PSD1 and planctomycete cytochrome C domain-containing protein [Acidobacteria bacterium]|nr:PSD1 and planctomycete cytochrome C domain-containing protein [Acidobacteriota bacterium]